MKPVLYIISTLVVIGLLLAGYVWAALAWSYSSGDRAGFLQKFSNKGWVCKTWEGELSLVAMPGATPEKFLFTVRDEAVAKRIEAAMGRRVTLVYEEHKGLPTSCFGETAHFVVDLKEVSHDPIPVGELVR
jgi:hypothetical protein